MVKINERRVHCVPTLRHRDKVKPMMIITFRQLPDLAGTKLIILLLWDDMMTLAYEYDMFNACTRLSESDCRLPHQGEKIQM